MKRISLFAALFAATGIVLMGIAFAYPYPSFLEPGMLFGFASLALGACLSFWAFIKKEQGTMKLFPVLALAVVAFAITWFDPFSILRMLTWLKN
ncbi:hypothetical protein [Priestia koreensis]|uniref:hypothetical protein n=1 Tax=Priestia koreensis TaxID=284581 RepID=UPI001F593292|nr:hypothetical protein [Priestia koreensis]UNL83617.1 hypothetical protein IE339_15780 [Priestia koreensis]